MTLLYYLQKFEMKWMDIAYKIFSDYNNRGAEIVDCLLYFSKIWYEMPQAKFALT